MTEREREAAERAFAAAAEAYEDAEDAYGRLRDSLVMDMDAYEAGRADMERLDDLRHDARRAMWRAYRAMREARAQEAR